MVETSARMWTPPGSDSGFSPLRGPSVLALGLLVSLFSAQGLPDPELYAVMSDRPVSGDQVKLVGRNLTSLHCAMKLGCIPGMGALAGLVVLERKIATAVL
jgi:hypothetical protein